MPRYFFHLIDEDLVEEDDLGQELPDVAAALVEAHRSAREIRLDVNEPGSAFVRVVDATGTDIGTVFVSESMRSRM
jgi:hypothetical protein